MAEPVAFILKGYPRLSEAFIAQEILGLLERGLDIRIYSMRPPREAARHPINDEIAARLARPVTYLPERLRDAPSRVLVAGLRALTRRGGLRALRAFLGDMVSDPSLDRVRRFGQALVLARELPDEVGRLHAHFLHTPASVARYGSLLTGRPWSCSAHAKDIWTLTERETRAKLAELDWIVTCTGAGFSRLSALADDPAKVHLAYHGLDAARFPPTGGGPEDGSRRDGRDPAAPVRLLSVGRAVDKKGFDLLIDALAKLPADVHWRWCHIGAGERLEELQAQVWALGLGEQVSFEGAKAQSELLAAYRSADLFVLPCRVAADGDRDGLPNVLMEAQSQSLACLSTRVSAIPELIEDGVSGRLVPPDDVAALTAALSELIGDPALRDRLGAAGAVRVREAFSHEAGLRILSGLFGLEGAGAAAAGSDRAA